ncbi:MAG: hypothetical protein AAGL49_14695, partial [Pseudomonadota bacterium]
MSWFARLMRGLRRLIDRRGPVAKALPPPAPTSEAETTETRAAPQAATTSAVAQALASGRAARRHSPRR